MNGACTAKHRDDMLHNSRVNVTVFLNDKSIPGLPLLLFILLLVHPEETALRRREASSRRGRAKTTKLMKVQAKSYLIFVSSNNTCHPLLPSLKAFGSNFISFNLSGIFVRFLVVVFMRNRL